MRGPYTIQSLIEAYSAGLSPSDHIRALWDKLTELGVGPLGDTSIIYLPTWEQVQEQLDSISSQNARALPLFGVPFAVKDNIDVKGWPTTAACPSYQYMPESTATVVAQLQKAGAILLAKTNLDQFATGLVGTRSPFGAVPNPFHPDYVSGGSSSGSASLVSRGLVCFSLGTDTAGSGRIPAGFCNLVGMKPTPGLVSTQGVLPACKTLDVVSFFALTVDDAVRVFHEGMAPESTRDREPRFHYTRGVPRFSMPKPLRVGIPEAPIFGDVDYRVAYSEALQLVDSLGWQTTAIDMTPLKEIASLLYEGPWVAERYGVMRSLLDASCPDLDPTVGGIASLGKQFSALNAFEAQYRLRDLAVNADKIFSSVDVLFLPTAPGLPLLKRLRDDPIAANSALGEYTNFVNLLGWSALALPASFTAQGLPFGITLVAPGGQDYALLDLGHDWQRLAKCPLGMHLEEIEPSSDSNRSQWPCPGESISIAMVGAHLEGMPLHWQVQKAGARLRSRCQTSPNYSLFALRQSVPAKPGLRRVVSGGVSISVEVYDFPLSAVGSFLAQVPHPLGLGNVELSDGTWVKGFICEPIGFENALEISEFGGWRSFIESGAIT